jgi:hypothetical protein
MKDVGNVGAGVTVGSGRPGRNGLGLPPRAEGQAEALSTSASTNPSFLPQHQSLPGTAFPGDLSLAAQRKQAQAVLKLDRNQDEAPKRDSNQTSKHAPTLTPFTLSLPPSNNRPEKQKPAVW